MSRTGRCTMARAGRCTMDRAGRSGLVNARSIMIQLIIPTAILLVVPAAVATVKPGNNPAAIVGVPNVRVSAGQKSLALRWFLKPPIVRTRIGVVPADEPVMPPVGISAQPWANDETDAEGNKWRTVRLLVKDLGRHVARHINAIWIGRQDFDIAVIIDDLLLRGGLQVAQVIGGHAEALDGIHDVLLLILEGLAKLRGPIQVIVHPFQNIRIMRERNDALVEGLGVHLAGVAAVVDITVGHNDLGGQRCGRQQHSHQGVGIECNRPNQLVHLRVGEGGRDGHGRRNFVLRPGHEGQREDDEEEIQDCFHVG